MSILELFEGEKKIVEGIRKSERIKYEIASVMDSYRDTKEVYVTVQVKGTAKTFNISVKELYQKKWLNEFSREDVAYIGFLYAAEESDSLSLIKQFPRKRPEITKSVVILGMLFVSLLIAANIAGFKIVEVPLAGMTIHLPAGLLFFPLTYFFDDTLTEVYGFKVSRIIIWGGLLCNTVFTLSLWATTYLPAASFWKETFPMGEEAYKLILTGSMRIVLASTIAYFCGEFLNSMIIAKMKILTSGRYFFLRVIGSTAAGVGIDSIIFCHLAFFGIMSIFMIWQIIAAQYIFKLIYEIMMLPMTYRLTRFLKKLDKVDYYDFYTRFNPFSLSLVD